LADYQKSTCSGSRWVVCSSQWVNVGNATDKQKPLQFKKMATVDYFERKLDDKHRLTIPVELRSEFKSGIVVTRGFGKYLHLYSQEVWDKKMEPELKGQILDERVADLNVQFRTGKATSKLDDKQGRFTLELHHLKYAGIGKEVVAIRAGAYWRLQAKKEVL
jgi:DNA-binding transcriptional regulator/RsmH inhibitor MraZ